MNDNLMLALYPRAVLAKDAGLSIGSSDRSALSLVHLVKSKQAVDDVMRQAENAGARATDPAHIWFGEATPAISRISADTCRKLPGILPRKSKNRTRYDHDYCWA